MKLLSDFDGVWTHPEEEAREQGQYLDETLVGWALESERPLVAAWLREARATTQREPSRYGWAPGGRLSAFADEDPFAAHSALLHYINDQGHQDPVARGLVAAVRDHGFQDLDAFGGHTHATGVERVARRRGPAIPPAAADAGRRLLERGVEIVVASNSGTAKLVQWFGHAGVPHTEHPESRAGALRLRGGARKFVLDGTGSQLLELGSVRVEVARPFYAELLTEERPDAVVGDVFSLDLALPLALKRGLPGWSDVRLFWLIHPYTPDWLRRQVEGAAPGEIETVDGGLPAVAERLAPS